MNAKEAEAFGALEDRIAELAQKVGQLQAKLDAVPVQPLKLYWDWSDWTAMVKRRAMIDDGDAELVHKVTNAILDWFATLEPSA